MKEYRKHHYCRKCKRAIRYKYHKGWSRLCASCAKSGKNNPNYGNPQKRFKERTSRWKGGSPVCKDCGKILIDYRSRRCKECNGKIRSRFLKQLFKNPKNHYRYIHGKGNEEYPIIFSKKFRESIRIRDNRTCQLCGKTKNIVGGRLKQMAVHHIDYDKQNCKKNNLITLCNSCNLAVNINRNFWTEFFLNKTKNFNL